MVNDVLLLLPHRQYVFTLPKCLRVFFRHDRKLFGEVSRLIFQMIQSFYNEVAGKAIRTASVISFQTVGDFLRFNSHYHGIILEGGFDEEGNFAFIPFGNFDKMSEYFRRMIIKFFLDKKLINERFAQNLLTWRHSGFSINNVIRINGSDEKARENLAELSENREIPSWDKYRKFKLNLLSLIVPKSRLRYVFLLPLRHCFISLDENFPCKSDPL